MKKGIHPENYREVLFVDNASGEKFLLYSTIETDKEEEYNGKKYPVVYVEVSSASHPVYTGEQRTIDTTGRVEKFLARQKKAQEKAKK